MAVSLYPFSVKTVSAASSRRFLRVRLRSWTLMKLLPREKPTDQSVGKYSAGQCGRGRNPLPGGGQVREEMALGRRLRQRHDIRGLDAGDGLQLLQGISWNRIIDVEHHDR